jgi:hypothetical protein
MWARLSAITLALVVPGAAGAVACSTSSSTGLAPTTGILIRAETLTSGRGCGSDPTQLFKYVVVVYKYSGGGEPADRASYRTPVTTNAFDCYTDGAFISLPAVGGNSSYRLEVFAYNRAAYEAARETIDFARSVGRRQDEGPLNQYRSDLQTTTPTWTTECTATQQVDVQALASCDPLSAGLGGLGEAVGATTITLDTTRFTLPGGRVATCAAGVTDAGADAADAEATDAGADAEGDGGGLDASADAGDAGPVVPGGADITFAKLRVRTRVGMQVVTDTIVPCPAPYTLAVVGEPTHYELDVGFLDAAEQAIDPAAQALCTVTSKTGTSSSAVCR